MAGEGASDAGKSSEIGNGGILQVIARVGVALEVVGVSLDGSWWFLGGGETDVQRGKI